MLISTLMLIPWIVYGFRHPAYRFIGLRQSKCSTVFLLLTEIVFFIALIFLLDEPDKDVAGQGSFAWSYFMVYEKGIFPLLAVTENFTSISENAINEDHKWLYLLTALMMDYLILKLISPSVFPVHQKRKITKRNVT